jgi:hypothetical protein
MIEKRRRGYVSFRIFLFSGIMKIEQRIVSGRIITQVECRAVLSPLNKRIEKEDREPSPARQGQVRFGKNFIP